MKLSAQNWRTGVLLNILTEKFIMLTHLYINLLNQISDIVVTREYTYVLLLLKS